METPCLIFKVVISPSHNLSPVITGLFMIIHDYSWWEDFPTKPPFGVTLEHRVLVHLGFLLSHGLRFDGSAPLFIIHLIQSIRVFYWFLKTSLELGTKRQLQIWLGARMTQRMSFLWPHRFISFRMFAMFLVPQSWCLSYLVLTCGLFKQPESWAFQSTFSRLLISAAFLQSDLNVGNVASSPRRGWIFDGSVDLRR